MKVLLKESKACWVDFYYEIEIDDSTEPQYYNEAANDTYDEGEYEYLGSNVQDGIDFYSSHAKVVDSLPCSMESSNE